MALAASAILRAPVLGPLQFEIDDVANHPGRTKNTYIDAAPIAARVQPRSGPVKAG